MSEFNKIHDEEGWIEWHGGARPVSGETNVDVKFRDTDTVRFKARMQADEYYWSHDGTGADIVAYRVISEPSKKLDTYSDPQAALQAQVGGDHYKGMVIQPVEYIHKNGIPFIEGSVIKYVSRWRDKGGIEDLEKAKHFLSLLIEMELDKTGGEL